MSCIDKNAKEIALVVDSRFRLMGTVTDGDIRRAILSGMNLDLSVKVLLERKQTSPYAKPITAEIGTPENKLIELMNHYSVRHIPLLDKEGRVVDLTLLSDLIKEQGLPITAVVMAGGYGKRLRPLTKKVPKPLLRIGKKTILEFIFKQLERSGIHNIKISTFYQRRKIKNHFGNGKPFGSKLQYLTENRPLGTAGALSQMKNSKEPILVVNGDILTKLNFRAMLNFHREHKADMTVAVQKYDMQLSYGVIETDGFLVRRISEKPRFLYLVNAGIYLMEAFVPRLIPPSRFFDMTDLIQKLLDSGKRVVSFPIREYWLDIGNHRDYNKARGDVKRGELKL